MREASCLLSMTRMTGNLYRHPAYCIERLPHSILYQQMLRPNASKSMEKYRDNHNNGSDAVQLLDKRPAWWINCSFFFDCCNLAEVIEGILTNTTEVTLIQIGFPRGPYAVSWLQYCSSLIPSKIMSSKFSSTLLIFSGTHLTHLLW